MGDRYDPKLSGRPRGERRAAEARDEREPAGEDPLVEWTRVVSGRSSYDPSEPVSDPAPSPANAGGDLTSDLESELLSDLQASFAAIQGPLAAAAAGAANAAAPAEPAVEMPPEPAPEEPPPASFAPTMPTTPAPPPEPSRGNPPGDLAAVKPDMPESLPPRPELDERPPMRSRATPRPPLGEPEVPPGPPPRQSFFRRNRNQRAAVSEAPLRPTMAAAGAAPARQPEKTNDWDWPEPAPSQPEPVADWDWPDDGHAPPHVPSRFAPPGAAAAAKAEAAEAASAPVEVPLALELEIPEALPAEAGPLEEEPELDLETLATVPGYGDEDEIPPLSDEDLEELVPRRSNRGLMIVAGLFAIVVIGGLGFIMFRSTDVTTGAPPIITADSGPTKIVPEQTPPAPDPDQPGKLIYDRVDETTDAADSHLVTPSQDTVTDIPAPPSTDDNPISRVIVPGGPAVDGPIDATTSPADQSVSEDVDSTSIGPRKVRTVIVRPDGTIVSNSASPADATADDTHVASTGPASDAASSDMTSGAPAPPASPDAISETSDNYQDLPPVGRVGPAPGDAAASANPRGTTEPPAPRPAPSKPTASAPSVPAPTPIVPSPRPVTTNEPASSAPSAPIDLTPPTKPAPQRTANAAPAERPPAQTRPAVAASGTFVQIASLPSEAEAQATFRRLQARYPNILGGYTLNIQRADLGSRGIYYRARVGPIASRSQAAQLCTALKAVGGDCLLASH